MEAADLLLVNCKNKDEITSAIKDIQLLRDAMTR